MAVKKIILLLMRVGVLRDIENATALSDIDSQLIEHFL